MTTEDFDFNKICRICCSNDGQMMSIFKVHIHKKLMACASVQVWQNDNLPMQICTKCIAKLHIAFQFKKLCEKSDARLRNYLLNLNDLRQRTENRQHPTQSNVTQQDQVISHQLVMHSTNSTLPLHNSVNNSNDYVYVECTSNLNDHLNTVNGIETNINHGNGINELKPFDNNQNIESQTYGVPLQSYPTNIQFQTYNVQVPQTNQILTLTGQCTGGTSMNGNSLQSFYNPQTISTGMSTIMQSDCSIQNHSMKDRIGAKLCKLMKPTINNDVEISCSTCGKHFDSLIKLNRHHKTHSNEMPYRCKICHKGFTHSGNFKVHMRMHTDERPYQCTMCNRACRQQQDLEKHMRTHTGERPHVCQVCSKAFSTSSNLIAHSRIHSGEKPYVCSICQKAFCQSNELTKHTRTHTGEKSHICKLCSKGFNGSSTLVVHMRSHTGERPYACNICSKAFTQSSCLQVHLKRHRNNCNFNNNNNNDNSELSNDNDYKCVQCDTRFHCANDLNKHIKSHSVPNDLTVI